MASRYDVVIMGGGLAGLTLAIQLKRQRPDTSIFVAEKREGPAPDAAFKVGESTVEQSATYFADVVGMRDHMEKEQNKKYGLRFFSPAGDNSDITKRVEYGLSTDNPIKSYQLDRGRFENALADRARELGVDLHGGTRVTEVEIGDPHRVTVSAGGGEDTVEGRWLIDACGRAFMLKRKLGLEKDNAHNINSSWIRLDGGLDLEDWGRDDKEWMARMPQPGLRQFSTNHLMGEGYWVWLIPLVTGAISIGLCADPRFHPFEEINTLDGLLAWFAKHEPQLAASLEPRRDQILDFLKVENFSYDCERVYSPERWCLTGEAGAFADPFLSPGSDFIAHGNLFIGDCIVRDLGGEDVEERIELYNFVYSQLFEGTMGTYTDQYVVMGNPQAMLAKLAVNGYFYFGIPALVSLNRKNTDVDFMQAIIDVYGTAGPLMGRMEELFRDWAALEKREFTDHFFGVNEWEPLWERAVDMAKSWSDEELEARLNENVRLLQNLAVIVFHKAAQLLPDVEVGDDVEINPMAISLHPEKWEEDGLFSSPGITVNEARQLFPDIDRQLFLDVVGAPT